MYRKGYQTAVPNSNSGLVQVQTWSGEGWSFFKDAPAKQVKAEKKRQLDYLKRKGIL